MTQRIQIYDTTLRDGSQGEGVNFSLQDKLLIAQKLDELGFDYIEGGYPLSNPKDFEFFQRAAEMTWKHAKICAFGMTRRRDCKPEDDIGMQALRDSKASVCTVVGKTWDLHVFEVLRVDESENLAMIRDSVGYLAGLGRELIYDAEHFFDGWRANPEFALKTVKAAEEAGASMVCLCDTNGGRLPEEVAAAVTAVRAALKVPVGIHCHNDGDLAVANSLAALDAGALQVQGTINGIGERCGNVDLISVVANMTFKKRGYEMLREGSVQRLCDLSHYVYELANLNHRNNQAWVGRSAFAHKGGMHVHAVNRIAHSYEHIDPSLIGNERRVLVSELSGRSNIVAKATKYKLDNDNELMKKILDRVQDLENEGYQFEAAEASFDLLIQKVAGNYSSSFRRKSYHVHVQTDGDSPAITTAVLKLSVSDRDVLVAGEGDGPVNALDNALRQALVQVFPNLAQLRLVDYKVRVINSTEGTAARVRVVIESRDDNDGEVINTVGVSENVIEASWLALVDSVEYKLLKDAGIVIGNGRRD